MTTRKTQKPTLRVVRQWALEWLQKHTESTDSLEDVASAYLRWLGESSRPSPDEPAAELAWGCLEKHYSTDRPALYAWEYLLAAAQPGEKTRAGVYFTPSVISRWLAAAALSVLRDAEAEFTIIDPACGSGAMLAEAIKCVSQEYPSRLSCDVFGIEKNRSTAALAAGLLHEPAPSRSHRSVKICCADALSCASLESLGIDCKGPLVILGNPPYSTGKRCLENASSGPRWIDGLLADYRTGLGERKNAIADDYVRFLRWSQYQIEQAGNGVLAMITSRTFLEGITHRRMRESLRSAFDKLYLVDLAGDMSRNRDPRLEPDENIFPIRSGTALLVFVRGLARSERAHGELGAVFYHRLTGTRKSKLEALAKRSFEEMDWCPCRSDVWGQASSSACSAGGREYDSWPSLEGAFHVRISGVQSKNDELWTADTREALVEQIRNQAGFEPDPGFIREYGAAPFVTRFIYYDPQRIGRARFAGMRHMLQQNVGLVFARQSTNDGAYDQVMATRDLIVDRFFYSRRGTPYLAPLVLYEADGQQSNFRPEFVRRFVGSERSSDETLFAALLALLSSRVYRSRFAEELRRDFPRVPPAVGFEAIECLATSGRQLIAFHCEPVTLGATDEATFTADELRRAESWTLGGFRVLKRWGRDRAMMPVADNEQWRPILHRWRAIEQTLDRIDPVVSELLDRTAN